MAYSLSLNQDDIFNTCKDFNVGHRFPFCDAVEGKSGMDSGHQHNCTWRTAPVFRYSQSESLPIYGSPFLKNHRLRKPPLQCLTTL